jgi:hypothetical protein
METHKPNCFKCDSVLPERGYFCKNCGVQIKCKECNDLLLKDANVCVMCGTFVGIGNVNKDSATNMSVVTNQPINTFEFRETRNERTAKATLTNDSVESLKETLSLVVSSYPLATIVRKNNSGASELNDKLSSEESLASEKAINIKAKQIPQVRNETAQKLERLFYSESDRLVLEIEDLKASGQKDYGIRLVYLRLLYSKEVNNEELVLREDLNETLKEAMGFLDPNVINWISTTNHLALKVDEDKTFLRLKGDGYIRALEILEEIYNSDIKAGEIPGKKSRNVSKSSSKLEEPQKTVKTAKKRSEKSKEAEEWIKKWKELNLNIDLHGIAKDLSVADRVVLALWVINKVTNGSINSATTYKIAPIIQDLFFAPGNRQNLNKALKDGYKDNLQKTPDGWRITPTGIKHAESLVGVQSTNSKVKNKK